MIRFTITWLHLASITKISPNKARESVKTRCKNLRDGGPAPHPERLVAEGRRLYEQDFEFLFGNCQALKKLKTKAEAGFQLSRVEAFNLANLLLSVRNGSDLLLELIRNSYGQSFNPSTTQKETSGDCPFIRHHASASFSKASAQAIAPRRSEEETKTLSCPTPTQLHSGLCR